MPTLWIIHRDERQRAALARLAAAGDDTILGAPTDPLFESATPADVVVLGLSQDQEQDLEFANRVRARLPACRWVLVAGGDHFERAPQLFDTLHVEVLRDPPPRHALRAAIRRAAARREPPPLSERRSREVLAERFARWFARQPMPHLMRALDPRLIRVPLFLLGEPGTGRSLLARYVHAFGAARTGPFVSLSCVESLSEAELLDQLEAAAGWLRAKARPAPADVWTVWLEEVDQLPRNVQRRVRDWVEFGAPAGVLPTQSLRWIACAGDPESVGDHELLDPRLAQTLSGVALRLAPVRENPERIHIFVADTIASWCDMRGERNRSFSEEALDVLCGHPWPGNLGELESVILRTLALSDSEPVLPHHLCFEEGGREVHSNSSAATRPTATSRSIDPPDAADEPPFIEAPLLDDKDEDAGEEELRLVSTASRQEPLHAEPLNDGPETVDQHPPVARQRIDVSGLLDALLDEKRDLIQTRRLLVLKELDRTQPFALGDAVSLERALRGLVGRALEVVPERGDIYLATRHHQGDPRGNPTVRVLLRYRGNDEAGSFAASSETGGLEFALAEEVIVAQGGSLTVDRTDSQETVVLIDLDAPPLASAPTG